MNERMSEFMKEWSNLDEGLELYDAGDVVGLEPGDSEVERLLEAVVDALADEAVEVDRPPQQLDMSLAQQGLVSVGRRRRDVSAESLALLLEPFVEQNAENNNNNK